MAPGDTVRHVNYSLKPATIDNAKPKEKPYSLTDGGGLLIEVLTSGSKVWRFKYHLDGKREKVTIGSYPEIGIKAARDRHEELRVLVERGQSPAKAKQADQAERKQEAERAVTFEAYSRVWIQDTLFYRSAGYRAQTTRWLDQHINPKIGDMALADVKPRHVLEIIEGHKATPVMADRLRVIIQQIYNFAIRRLLVEHNPALPIKGAIVVPPREHHRHLNEKELAAWWRLLPQQGAHATTVLAAQLLYLTMTRKVELLRSTWDEFDLDAATWDIPKERMKMRRPHRVYLSTQAVEKLQAVRQLVSNTGGDAYVFPSIYKAAMPMGLETLNHFFGRIDFGVSDFSPHGTRGTAATLLREHGYRKDVVELLLAHAERNQTTAAYNHHELAEERRAALQFLANHTDKLAAGGGGGFAQAGVKNPASGAGCS